MEELQPPFSSFPFPSRESICLLSSQHTDIPQTDRKRGRPRSIDFRQRESNSVRQREFSFSSLLDGLWSYTASASGRGKRFIHTRTHTDALTNTCIHKRNIQREGLKKKR
mmetsp:Transcript_31707/g.62752  ORF Transcript_31707/g.62752 Transcript_31707/m.62752 type:complete len:110 (-) Transcript_31707:894-1223(-)